MTDASVDAAMTGVRATCECGWTGSLGDVSGWAVERERDRLVRRCPDCEAARPEWGTFRGLDSVARMARGRIREALREAGVPGA